LRRDEFKLILNIDHHPSNTMFGDLNWVDPQAPAAGEMVYRLIKALGVQVDRDIAESVYTSLVTDTGGFKYTNTTPDTFRLAAELMEAGADVYRVCNRVFADVSMPALELLRLALAKLSTRENGLIGVLTLTQEDFKTSGAKEEDAENLVDFVRKLSGVEVAIFIKERPDGRLRLSLRSRNGLDVAALAAQFEGGGHKYASGAVLDGPMEQAVERVVEAIARMLKTQPRP
jgi:phosphoesterase RecJ-like protein